jgi:uncharacterized repeat protein (TIGR01451 family)
MKSSFLVITLLFIIHSSFAQTFNWGHSQGGTGLESTTGIIEDGLGNLYVVGNFNGTVDFNPGVGVFALTSVGASDIYIQKLDTSGNFIWAKSFGSNGGDGPNTIHVDDAANVLVSGFFYNTIDFDPGIGVSNLTSNGSSDIFVLKLNSYGDFIWVKSIGGSGAESIYSLVPDDAGNLYLTGYFYNTIDCDPGVGIFNLTSNGQDDVLIEKLDPFGNFIWAKSLGGTTHDTPGNIVLDHFGDVYVNGSFEGIVDIDPGLATHYVTSDGFSDMFILKLDNLGNYQWCKDIGSTSFESGKTLTVDEHNNIYASGSFFGTYVDFNPGTAAPVYLHSAGGSDVFIIKITMDGVFQWAKSIGATGSQFPYTITYNPTGFLYLTGSFAETVDFDPGLATDYLVSAGGADVFLEKLDTVGNAIWTIGIGGNSLENGANVFSDLNGNIYLAGDFNSSTLDIDPTEGSHIVTSAGSYDSYLIKLSQGLCSDFTVVVDSLSHVTCTDSGFAFIHPIYAANPIDYLWNIPIANTGATVNFETSGIYSVSATDANNCVSTANVIIGGPISYSNFDLNAHLISSSIRTGDPAHMWIDAFNDGCLPASGTLTLILDGMTSYTSSNPSPNYLNGDTLKWYFNDLTYDSVHFMPAISITTSQMAMIGDTLCFTLVITPTNDDFNPDNNIKHICLPVVSSYDPNDKKVYPSGICEENYILNEQTLSYTVRFQNTGSAEAHNIFVLDSLSPFLDIQSLRIVSNSHSVISEFLPGNVLKFRFDNIYLADSSTNEPESHGYIIYEIDPIENLTDGSIISNKAAIYFDYNPAVITNSVENTIIDCQMMPFDFSLSSTSICLNDSIYAAFDETGTCYNHTWSIDTILSTVEDLTLIPSNPGTFNLVIERNNGLCFKDSSVTIIVNSIPIVTLDPFNSDTVCDYVNQIELPLGFPVGGLYSGNGVNGSFLNTSTAGIGSHQIVYIYTDTNGCLNESTVQITIESCLNTSILSHNSTQVYPNPFSNKLFVSKPIGEQCVLRIYNLLSQVVSEYIIPNNETENELDTGTLDKGIYLIVLESSRNIRTQTMVKN